MRCAAMRMDARRAAQQMVVPFASRPPKQTPHCGPTRRERRIAGTLRRCRFAYWYAPTALTAPSTAPAIHLSHAPSQCEQGLNYKDDGAVGRAPGFSKQDIV